MEGHGWPYVEENGLGRMWPRNSEHLENSKHGNYPARWVVFALQNFVLLERLSRTGDDTGDRCPASGLEDELTLLPWIFSQSPVREGMVSSVDTVFAVLALRRTLAFELLEDKTTDGGAIQLPVERGPAEASPYCRGAGSCGNPMLSGTEPSIGSAG